MIRGDKGQLEAKDLALLTVGLSFVANGSIDWCEGESEEHKEEEVNEIEVNRIALQCL